MAKPYKHSQSVKGSLVVERIKTPDAIRMEDGGVAIFEGQTKTTRTVNVEELKQKGIGCRKQRNTSRYFFERQSLGYRAKNKHIKRSNEVGTIHWEQLTKLHPKTRFNTVKALIDLIKTHYKWVKYSRRDVYYSRKNIPIDQTTYNNQTHRLTSDIPPALKPSRKAHNQQERQEIIQVLTEVMSSGEIAAQSLLNALSVLRPRSRNKFLKAFLNNNIKAENSHLILSFEKSIKTNNRETTIGEYSWFLLNSINGRKELIKFSTRRAFILYSLYAFDKKNNTETNTLDITTSKPKINALYKLVYYADKTGHEDKSKEDSDIDYGLFKGICNFDDNTGINQTKTALETKKKYLINSYNAMKKAVIETCNRMDETCELLIIKNYRRHLTISQNKIQIDSRFIEDMNKYQQSYMY